jgi:hypothetical protein
LVGAYFERMQDSYFISQPHLIESLNEHFNVPDKFISTPSPPGEVLLKGEGPIRDSTRTIFRSGVGKLLYLIKHSRTDVASSVRDISKFMSEANEEDLKSMYRVMQFT